MRTASLILWFCLFYAPYLQAQQRIWVVPFRALNGVQDNTAEALRDLSEVYLSQLTDQAVVDRAATDTILREHELGSRGLVDAKTRLEIGKLLGATVILAGDFGLDDETILVSVELIEVESSRVLGSVNESGDINALAELTSRLITKLAPALGKRFPALRTFEVDKAPVFRLHFMRALNLYYAGRYQRALGYFLQSASEPELSFFARLWAVDCYLASEWIDQACLALSDLAKDVQSLSEKTQVAQRQKHCM